MLNLKRFFTRLVFKFNLDRGKLIKVDDRHRGIGKTTMLIDKAITYEAPIIVGFNLMERGIKRINPNVDVVHLNSYIIKNIEGVTFPNGVLLDESLDPRVIAELHKRDIKILGGFINKENVK